MINSGLIDMDNNVPVSQLEAREGNDTDKRQQHNVHLGSTGPDWKVATFPFYLAFL